MRGSLGQVLAAAMLAGAVAGASAQAIYTCVDAKGRRLTSDRPIIDCIDREQSQITPGGQVVRRIGPSLTADERAAEEARARRAQEERNRQLEEKRRDRALLARYPDRASHDKDREQALETVDEVIKSAYTRIGELRAERKRLDAEMEFYRADPKKVPATLRRHIDENEQQLAAQTRFIQNQDDEKRRINARYDEELQHLKPLWQQHAAALSPASSSAAR